ncbi:secretion system protein E [Acidobacteria bacterium Mor1]|nr:secretion system protein E [Acidobacteria bacterium Mor1]
MSGSENQASKTDKGRPEPDSPGLIIAGLLVEDEVLGPEDLAYAQRVQEKLTSDDGLTAVIRELNLATQDQITASLRKHRPKIRLGDLLLELGLVTPSDLRTALAFQQQFPEKKLGEVLIETHILTERDLIEVLSIQLGFRNMEAELHDIDPKIFRKIKPEWMKKRGLVPIRETDEGVLVAFVDPLESEQIAFVTRELGSNIVVGIARWLEMEAAIERMAMAVQPQTTVTGDENEIVALVNWLLAQAAQDGVSDIHVEPSKDKLRVRFRQDGVLVPFREYPIEIATPLMSRIKVLAGADIAERRRHQDGRMMVVHGGRELDLRVSFYVTIHGEKAVLRLLNTGNMMLDIKEIGMSPRMGTRFKEDVLDVPGGVVIVTGPTGSGKTTTLYGAVGYLNNVNTSIITAEDPVEYVIDGISQCSINTKINITYEETLRHIVRQDPDVIVIGEIRDRFSADTAIQAALTGHKVLTTFHTEDSIGGLLRLLNMNIEAFLISSTVVSVLAQRLVRRLCQHCSEDHDLTPDELRRLGYNPAEIKSPPRFKRAVGCERCSHRGYRGRVAIFELLVLNEPVKDALISRKTSHEIRRISTETTGLVTLLEDGITKAARGEISFEEIIRKLPRLSKPRPYHELRRLQGEVG